MSNKKTPTSASKKPAKKKGHWFQARNFHRGPHIVSAAQPQINIGPTASSSRHTPYQAWRHYFPTEDYFAQSATVERIKIFELYMDDYFKEHDMNVNCTKGSVSVDCKDLATHKAVAEKIPMLMEELSQKPEHTISCLGLATHQHIIKKYQSLAGQAQSQLVSSLADVPVIRARLYNYEPLTALKHLKARTYGKLVAIKGTLVKVSNVKPLCTTMAFKCVACGHLQAILLIDNNYMTPTSCLGYNCKGRTFEPQRNHPLTEITDWQLIKLQESASDEQRETGRMPRTIEVELTRDLTDAASPGDVVTITGIVKVKKSEDGRWKVKDKSMFLLYIEGNHVNNTRGTIIKDCRSNSPEHLLDFSERDLAGINEIQKQNDVFPLLVSSLCPTIYGQDMVKAGLLLSLFGGSQKEDNQKDRMPVRGNSHILLVGDPGLGKSQLLQAVSRLAPRGVYVCGNASSNSGLTVTLSRDSSTGDTSLEAGALVLADQGVCCIDEFDKMSNQHQALLEAMEQQSISIAKAGVVCNMPARCSIVAAANPSGGHYNKAKTVSENLRMGGALLSRFDLVYILLDTPNEQRDKLLSDHVMAMHTGKKRNKNKAEELAAAYQCETHAEKGSLKEKLMNYASRDDCDPVPHFLLWKYIAYARKNNKQIKLSPEACQGLKNFYLELRQKGHQSDSTPITTRQLESLKRLSEARAKIELRTVVTGDDAADVVEIMRHSLYDTYSDETDALIFDRSMHGSGVSVRSKVKRLLAALIKAAEIRSSNNFSISDIRNIAEKVDVGSSVTNLIDSLNNQGYLLKSGAKMYKLQAVE
ncbi:unnamed protein product [Clavelina lepadiformis]|uniref:DNA helicase MCM8 n=1 Tax=Clavelina lepadiformis TaxID=159417 RepID=A0ABP0FET1_CLALP